MTQQVSTAWKITLSSLGVAAIALAGVATVSASADRPAPVLGDIFDSHSAEAEPATEPRSNLDKALGEPGELVDPAGEPVFSITITDVTAVDDCPSRRFDLEPTSGTFLVLEVEVSLDSHVLTVADEDAADVYFPLLPETFVLFDEGYNEISETATRDAWECFSDADLLPNYIFPGEEHQGYVVQEANVRTGQVAYMPAGAPGWEWRF